MLITITWCISDHHDSQDHPPGYYNTSKKIFSRYRALRTPSNILLVNLCVAGLIMISPLPLFYINLYHRGPHLGIIGAKVSNIQCFPVMKVLTVSTGGLWFSLHSRSHGADLAADLPDGGEGLGGLVHLSGQTPPGEASHG